MKRSISCILALLLLSLAACAAQPESPALKDQLSGISIPETAQPESSTQGEAAPETGSTGTRTPSGSRPQEASEGAPALTDYSGFAGLYVDDTSWKGGKTLLEIRVYGDILLLEFSSWADGCVYDIWVDEFWPDPDVEADGQYDSVTGIYQTFSTLSDTGCYQNTATTCTIVRTDGGVLLQRPGGHSEYRLDSTQASLHSSAGTLMTALQSRVQGQPLSSLCGTWTYNGEFMAAFLHLGEDGSFSYLCKERHRPAEVLEGVWTLDRENDTLAVQAEQIGATTMAYELNLAYEEEDGSLFLYDATGQPVSSLGYGMIFYQQDTDWATGFVLSQLSSCYTESLNTYGAGETEDGYAYYYSYRVPLFLSGESAVLDEINADICRRFEAVADLELERIRQQSIPATHVVDYYFAAYDGLEQLVLWTDSYYEMPDCAVYCYDSAQDTRLDTRALLRRMGISEEAFLDAVRTAAEDCFRTDNSFMTEDVRQDMGYDEKLAWTISDEAVNLDLPVLVTNYGEIAVIARIGAFAEVDYNYAVLYPFSDAVG